MTHIHQNYSRGVTLMDALVGSAVMIVVFVGIAGVFQLSLDVVINNKARAGAVALADERMEYIHSLSYDAIGTIGGIPSGSIPQSETVSLNGITYTRRTIVQYKDDPKDGLGENDINHIVEDYKAVKVSVSWMSHNGVRETVLTSRISPASGVESLVPGGTLFLTVINASGQPIAGASVSITNTSPSVNINTFTDTNGTVTLLGAPGATGYHIVVTKPGYSTDQTYAATAQNTNPNPADLTVVNYQSTAGTFAIDTLGHKIVNTWTQVLSGTWTDPFVDATKIATSSNVSIAGGSITLTEPAPYPATGELQSIAISPSYLNTWKSVTFADSQPPNTSILYHIYDGGGQNLIPDAQVPGNAAGFAGGVIDLSGVSTTTYPSIRLKAILSTTDNMTTPSLNPWVVSYTYGPQPLGSIAFTMQGAKSIGSGPSGTLYKYSANLATNASGTVTIPNLEWDTYAITVGSGTGYDVASACNPQPESFAPGATQTTNLYLTSHTAQSLLVDVRSAVDNSLVTGALVTLSRNGFTATSTTDTCGQSFFKNLVADTNYSISVSASGHAPYTASPIDISGTTRYSVSLN
jgi:hypothetical protein